MPSSRRRQRNRRNTHEAETQSTEKRRDSGLLYQGKWYCKCTPRLEASRREVRSEESANKGRFYFTCDICDFYLWEDKASKRHETFLQPDEAEQQLVIKKPKAETQKQLTSFFQVTPGRRPMEDYAQTTETPCPPSSKRKRDAFAAEQDEQSYGLTSDDDVELIRLADETVSSARKGRQKTTKSKPGPTASGRDPFITPATQRTVDVIDGLPTPSVTRTLFPPSSNKRQKTVSFEETSDQQTPSTCTTATVAAPTPSSASQPATPVTPGRQVPDISEEVMPLLQGERITPSTLESVRNVLVSSARKTKGLAASRDWLRDDGSKKDTKISRLQEKFEAAKNKNTLQNQQVTNMKAGIMKLHDDISKNQVTTVGEIKASLMKLYEQN